MRFDYFFFVCLVIRSFAVSREEKDWPTKVTLNAFLLFVTRHVRQMDTVGLNTSHTKWPLPFPITACDTTSVR